MNNDSQKHLLQRLLIAAAAGEADANEWQQLACMLEESEFARDYAVLLLDQMTSLEWSIQKTDYSLSPDLADRKVPAATKMPSPAPWGRLMLVLAGTVAAVLVLYVGAIWLHAFNGHNMKSAGVESHIVKPSAEDKTPKDSLPRDDLAVAWLRDMTPNAAWAADSGPDEFLLRLSVGKRLELTSGLARIEFASGAIIILEGPCVFIPTGRSSAALVRGRVTGRADNGNFRLATPGARVDDLGTEFGVSVDDEFTTDVIVFEGLVSVSPSGTSGSQENEMRLNAGATARVDANGKLAVGVVEGGAFQRKLPKAPNALKSENTAFSLVDVVCDGGLAGSIDPVSGDRNIREWRVPYGPGRTESDALYHRVSSRPMIDGVFIPGPRGDHTIISSSGMRFDLPESSGLTWGPIWARSQVIGSLPEAANDYWGAGTLPYLSTRLKTCRYGLLGIHANVGITFDLNACRQELKRNFGRLQGTVVKLDLVKVAGPNSVKFHPVRTIDFWIVVDGELRFSKRKLGPGDDGEKFDVPLRSNDRFLTLITTDGGDTVSFDNAFLVDPILTINQPESKKNDTGKECKVGVKEVL